MFYDNYIKACNLIGKSPSAVAEANGFNRSIVNSWKNGREPKDATLQKLADYFGVSISDLKGNSHLKVTVGQVTETTESKPMLKSLSAALEQLNEEGQEKLLDYAADLIASGRYKKDSQAGVGQKA